MDLNTRAKKLKTDIPVIVILILIIMLIIKVII